MNIPAGYIVGSFVSEDKNRFRCTVKINGTAETCYIASSCRLDNFVNLPGKTVLLKPTTGKQASIKHAVFAVKHKRSYVLLNSLQANTAVENSLRSKKLAMLGKRSLYKKEFTVDNYKADLYLPNSRTIVEIKSVITFQQKAFFPTVYSERALKQLTALADLLNKGYAAHLIIVALSPYIEEIEISKETAFYTLLKQCVARGLTVSAFTCRLLSNGNVKLDREIIVSM